MWPVYNKGGAVSCQVQHRENAITHRESWKETPWSPSWRCDIFIFLKIYIKLYIVSNGVNAMYLVYYFFSLYIDKYSQVVIAGWLWRDILIPLQVKENAQLHNILLSFVQYLISPNHIIGVWCLYQVDI